MILPGSITTMVLESLYWLLISHNFWVGIEDDQFYTILYPNWPFPGLEKEGLSREHSLFPTSECFLLTKALHRRGGSSL